MKPSIALASPLSGNRETRTKTPQQRAPKSVLKALLSATLALLVAAAMLLTGCSSAQKPIRIGWMPWDEAVSVSYLWKELLEERGYDVELVLAEVGPIFQGVSSGDLDLYLDGWAPATHAAYFEKYEGKFLNFGPWYTGASLTWAVPSYVDVDSLEDVANNADLFGSRIIGIEPGAGLTAVSIDHVIPSYGLEDWEFVQGSTVAMLAELERATQAGEPILVTLWHPHWAYSVFDIKDLEDPQGTLGEAEECQVLSRLGFDDDYPEVTRWLKNFELSDEQLAELERLVIQEKGVGFESEGVQEWLSNPENRALADSWFEKGAAN